MEDNKGFSEIEKKAINLIEKYGLMIREEVFSHRKHPLPCGGNYPDAKKGCSEDSEEYLLMKEFLNSHPAYKTKNSYFVRNWYGI